MYLKHTLLNTDFRICMTLSEFLELGHSKSKSKSKSSLKVM